MRKSAIPRRAQPSSRWSTEVTRREYSVGDFAQLERKDSNPAVVPRVYESRLVEPEELIRSMARSSPLAGQVTGNQVGALPKAKPPTIICSPPCATIKLVPAAAGDALWARHANTAIAPISIRCLLACFAPTMSLRSSTSGFLCRRTIG